MTPNKTLVTGSLNPVRISVAQVHGLSVSDRSDTDPLRSGTLPSAFGFLLIHESPLTDALFLLVSKSDEVTTT